MKIPLLIISFIFSGAVAAGQYCTENVTNVILHQNGALYFKTDKSCSSHWCEVKWDNEAQVNRAFSSLLASKAAGKSSVG